LIIAFKVFKGVQNGGLADGSLGPAPLLFVPRPCRKKSPSRALYGFVPQVSVNGCKDFASERNESLLSNCRAPLNLLQSYEEYFIPPNKITNIFQLFFVLPKMAHSKAM
jgi:hypothetical protein